ncbi:MAG: family 78 glycoside hydrolase catalytic domain [Phycisphaerae bacterium]
MKKLLFVLILGGTVLLQGCVKQVDTSGAATAVKLQCEDRTNPLGIDIAKPRLSWIVSAEENGVGQSAYQILVSSSTELLDSGKADLWDSGKVVSQKSFAVEYEGIPLTTELQCFWKVKLWDQEGNAGQWSETAIWTMGLMKPADFTAKWIAFDMPDEKNPLTEVSWIWDVPTAHENTSVGTRFFRGSFEAPAVQSARLRITADDWYSAYINGKPVSEGLSHSYIRNVDITSEIIAGTNSIAVSAGNNGTSDNPAGLLLAVILELADGSTKIVSPDESWKASAVETEGWKAPGFDDSAWGTAYKLVKFGQRPWQGTSEPRLPPARYFRGVAELDAAQKSVKRAYIHASALGIYQLYLNGKHVSKDYFSPGWSDYEKRVYYRTYDVTNLLSSGKNAIGAILADGWYCGYVGYAREREHYGKDPRFMCRLFVEYQDGSTDVFDSNDNWKASLGPITQADFLRGEKYDARKELAGWTTVDFDDSAWVNAAVDDSKGAITIQAAPSEPVIAYRTVNPIGVEEVGGKYIVDMGQNFAGVVKISVDGEPGQVINLRHAEGLNPDGSIYTDNLRSASSEDAYICKGGSTETWQPMFTFHGFRYLEITGLNAAPALDSITGLALSSDTPVSGRFDCSNALVNKIYQNAYWTQRMNFIDVPTDCPQRDERLGWTGDAQVYINTAAYMNDVHAFFTKWIVDLMDGQRSDGQFPMVAPLKIAGDDGGPAWADAGVICPWTIYNMYGDTRIIEAHYDSMKKFIDFCTARSTAEHLPPQNFHCFGDWLNIDDNTPADVIFTAYYAYSTSLFAEMAGAIGREDDAAAYGKLAAEIKSAFEKAYVSEDGKIKGDTQCAYVLAIAQDLLSEENAKLAAEHLVRRIHECDDHLSTGFVGTKDLMLVLAKIGRNDLAYKLLLNETFPSWGYTIKHGATTIWERWNGWTPEDGYNDPGMNSFAHYSFGAVCQWIFENIGGISPAEPGFGSIVIKPALGGGLTWSNCSYDSVRGTITCNWRIEGDKKVFDISVPANTTATIILPASESCKHSTEKGVASMIQNSDKEWEIEVAGGSYSFELNG